MNESEIAEELKEVKERLDKIETFLTHDGLSKMLNEKLSSNFTMMTNILVNRIEKIEKAIERIR
jgi:hypothetical protein